jgi:hypothetical protein
MIRRLFAVIATALLLIPTQSCGNPVVHTKEKASAVTGKSLQVGVDGYAFEGADYAPQTNFRVKMVYSKDLAEFRKQAGVASDAPLVAYTIPPHDNNGVCEIHIVDPRHQYWPEYIGHEFVHCLVGNFHRNQDVQGKADPTK